MGASLKETESSFASKGKVLVEISGPAGAGKTTLMEAMLNRIPGLKFVSSPDTRNIVEIPFFIKYGLFLMPTIFGLYKNNGKLTQKREAAWMVILAAWWKRLQSDCRLVVLDQGPIYFMAELYGLRPNYFCLPDMEGWWQCIFKRWASTLDFIVHLDGSDAILIHRIRNRSKWHIVKDKSDLEIAEFLRRFRVAYDRVISRLTSDAMGPKIIRFDTGQVGLEQMLDRLVTELFPRTSAPVGKKYLELQQRQLQKQSI